MGMWQAWPNPTTQCYVSLGVLYLWGSSCGVDDGSPTNWLSPDRDHLHSASPMFCTTLGFSDHIQSTTFQPGDKAVLEPEGEKGIRVGIFTNPQSATMGWNLWSAFVSEGKRTWKHFCFVVSHWTAPFICQKVIRKKTKMGFQRF